MVNPICALRDEKVGFINVSVVHSTDVAVRSFVNACKQPNSDMQLSRKDFSLWHIADFDSDSGGIVPVQRNLLVDGGMIDELY